MDCQQVRALSSDYLDQRLAAPEVSLLDEHLQVCPACRQEIEVLRGTISLLSSLDEIETSPDFLNQVQRKIDKPRQWSRLRRWFLEPFIVKVPLEVTALLLISITAFYLYQRSPELSGEKDGPAPVEVLPVPQDKPQEKVPQSRGQSREGQRMAEVETQRPAALEAEPSRPKPAEAPRGPREDAVALAPPSRVINVAADDIGLYERKIKALLEEMKGRVVLSKEAASGEGLLLTVELPQSRQAEFLAAVREEGSARATAFKLEKKADIESLKRLQQRDVLELERAKKTSPASEAVLPKDDPTVRFEIHIRSKN